MDSLVIEILKAIGISTVSKVAADGLMSILKGSVGVSRQELEQRLGGFLRMHGATATAANAVDIMAARGFILISNSSITGDRSASIGAGQHGHFQIGQDSVIRGGKAAIEMQGNAHIAGNNAGIHLGEDGSINFAVGK